MPIEPIPKERVVALVCLDMINNIGRCTTAAAQWMGGKILLTCLCPFTVVATLGCCWSLLIEPSLALLLHLGDSVTGLTFRVGLATVTTDGRSADWHG